jgi:hypothetical protein
MAGHGRKQIDEALLLALACGATAETAAQKVGVSKRTVLRRQKDPAFQQRLKEMRKEMVERCAGTMTAAGLEAVKTLVTLLNSAAPPSVRLGAARAILELAPKMRLDSDVQERLLALEQVVGASRSA